MRSRQAVKAFAQKPSGNREDRAGPEDEQRASEPQAPQDGLEPFSQLFAFSGPVRSQSSIRLFAPPSP